MFFTQNTQIQRYEFYCKITKNKSAVFVKKQHLTLLLLFVFFLNS